MTKEEKKFSDAIRLLGYASGILLGLICTKQLAEEIEQRIQNAYDKITQETNKLL